MVAELDPEKASTDDAVAAMTGSLRGEERIGVADTRTNARQEEESKPGLRRLPRLAGSAFIFLILAGLMIAFSILEGTAFLSGENFLNIAVDASELLLLAVGRHVRDHHRRHRPVGRVGAGALQRDRRPDHGGALRHGPAGPELHLPEPGRGHTRRDRGRPPDRAGLRAHQRAARHEAQLTPFIATLGTLGVFLGTAQILSGGTNVPYVPPAVQTQIGTLLGFLPVPIAIGLVVVVVAIFALHRTQFGRYTYAIGSNAEAARRVGIDVDRHLLKVYT